MVVALVVAAGTKPIQCADGWTNVRETFQALVVLVVLPTLATVLAGVYTAREHRTLRHQATLLVVAVVSVAAVTLLVSYAMLKNGPFGPCSD